MAMVQSGEGGSYANAQTSQVSGDTITSAGQFANTFTVPQYALKPGTTLRVTVQGVYTTTATASPLFNASLQNTPSGGSAADLVAAAASNLTLSTNQTNGGFGAVFTIICISTGSAGTLECQGMVWVATQAGAVTWINGPNAAVISSIDCTKTQALNVKITPTLVAGQAFTLRSMIVEVF